MRLSISIGLLAAVLATNTVAFQPQTRHQGWVSNKKMSLKSTQSPMNSNIVLRTDDEEDAFDSFKIGNARVHRYSTDGNKEVEAEYVMWYHGRSKEQDQGKDLPPLSTGRIGRATSLNGLSWKKDKTGSVSEDKVGVSLGLNTESWWGFDTAHVGLGNVLLPVSTPAVISEGGVYLMYYMGGSFEETPIADYIDKDVPADAKIKGMNMKIGVCVSQDGITWGRVEGDDPTGACMVPYNKNDPNLQDMATLRDDNDKPLNLPEELYCAWPDVVVNVAKDSEKSGFLMYYSTMTKESKQKCIACAVSKDGFRWDKRGLCLEPGDDGDMDAAGCARCHTIRNAIYNEESATWTEADGFTMYYEGVSKEDGKHRIMKAESDDGRSWTKCGVVLDVGESDEAWDVDGVGSPHILRMDDGSMRMYYTGQGAGGSTAVGVAKLDNGAPTWEREQATITFAEATEV